MKRPAEVYQISPRPYQGSPEDIDYGSADTRRVHHTGGIRYQGQEIFISEALAGWSVALKPQTDTQIQIWFSRWHLGHLDLPTLSFRAVRPDSPEASAPHPKH
jgi:hypothetical protein